MSEMKNISAVVWGDMSADSAADNYPTKTLCPECLSGYEIVAEEGASAEDCEDCGAESSEQSDEDSE